MATACLVLLVYGAWIGIYLGAGNDVRDFIGIGPKFVFQGAVREALLHRGPAHIGLDRGYHPSSSHNGSGYDGQFSYYIAVDPSRARYYMDLPSLRYSRILLPLAARGLALGSRRAIPWTLLLINWLAVGLGTWALAAWFQRGGRSRWWAMLYGFWPGVFIGLQRDLTEPLAYALVLVGALLIETRGRWRLLGAGLVFGLAGLARQTTLLFPVVYVLWIAFGGHLGGQPARGGGERRRAALLLLVLSLTPYLAYSLFLDTWLGSAVSTIDFSPIPFLGVFRPPFQLSHQGIDVTFVVLPAIVWLVALVPDRPLPNERWLPWLLLFMNVLANIVFYNLFSVATYTTISRLGIGIVISALMCVRYIDDVGPQRLRWLVAATVLAMAMFPVVAVQGFISLSS